MSDRPEGSSSAKDGRTVDAPLERRPDRGVRRAGQADRRGVLAAPGEGRLLDRRPARDRPCLPRADRQADGRSGQARRGAGAALAGQSRPLAERARPPARRARRTGRDRRTGRSPLCRPGLDRGADLRRRQAVLPALGRLAAPPGRRRRGPRAARSPQGRLLYPAVHQRDRAQQFSADQSRGAAQDQGDRGPQPDRGAAASAGRPGARQGPPADHAWPIRTRSRSAGTSPPRPAR